MKSLTNLSPSAVKFWHPHERHRIFEFYCQQQMERMIQNTVCYEEAQVAYFTRTSTLNAVSPWFFLNFYCLPNHLAFFTLVLNRKTSYLSGNSWTTVKARRSEDDKVLPKLVYDTVTKKKFSFQKRSFPFPYRGVVQLKTKPVNVRLRDSIGNRNRDL